MNIVEKWKDVLEHLEIKNELQELKLAKYAEHFSKIENQQNLQNSQSLLALNMKVMENLNFYELTSDSGKVETVTFEMPVSKETMDASMFPFAFVPMIENLIIKELTKMYRDKRLVVYTIVDSIQMISEKTMAPKITIRSQIKVK